MRFDLPMDKNDEVGDFSLCISRGRGGHYCGREVQKLGSLEGRGEVVIIVVDMLPYSSGKAGLSGCARNAVAITLASTLSEREE